MFAAALVLFPILTGIGLTVVLLMRGEPSYQGRSLSWWLRDYDAALIANGAASAAVDLREDRDEKAIAAMGTNAVPFLLAWISSREEPNPVQQLYSEFQAKYPRLGLPHWRVPTKNRMAYDGFFAIGRNAAETARPELVALMTNVTPGVSIFTTNGAPDRAAFYAGGVLWSLDKSGFKGGFDPCTIARPLFFPDP